MTASLSDSLEAGVVDLGLEYELGIVRELCGCRCAEALAILAESVTLEESGDGFRGAVALMVADLLSRARAVSLAAD